MTKNYQKKEALVFAQEDVYPKLVRLYIQCRRISEPISDANKLYEIVLYKFEIQQGEIKWKSIQIH